MLFQGINLRDQYNNYISALENAGLISAMPQLQRKGIQGPGAIDFPVPSLEQVEGLFRDNTELVRLKISQGFTRLELIPMAMDVIRMAEILQRNIIDYSGDGIYRTGISEKKDRIPLRINKEKQVWIWETLREYLEKDKMIYFPERYSDLNGGFSKTEMIHNRRICAFPGWSVGLSEYSPLVPGPGQGKLMEGRRQPESGLSPKEYLQLLRTNEYYSESGKTLEDFLTSFTVRMVSCHNVSHCIEDDNGLWCMGQYTKIPYAEVVPAARWIGALGRLRLDMHRTGNKKCAKGFGMKTMVRIPGIKDWS